LGWESVKAFLATKAMCYNKEKRESAKKICGFPLVGDNETDGRGGRISDDGRYA